MDLANLVFEPPASRGSAIQTDFCRPSARWVSRRVKTKRGKEGCPDFGGAGFLDSCRCRWPTASLELDWREHT